MEFIYFLSVGRFHIKTHPTNGNELRLQVHHSLYTHHDKKLPRRSSVVGLPLSNLYSNFTQISNCTGITKYVVVAPIICRIQLRSVNISTKNSICIQTYREPQCPVDCEQPTANYRNTIGHLLSEYPELQSAVYEDHGIIIIEWEFNWECETQFECMWFRGILLQEEEEGEEQYVT